MNLQTETKMKQNASYYQESYRKSVDLTIKYLKGSHQDPNMVCGDEILEIDEEGNNTDMNLFLRDQINKFNKLKK